MVLADWEWDAEQRTRGAKGKRQRKQGMLAQGMSQSPVYARLRLYQLSSPTGSAENLKWSERLEFNSLHSLESKQINHVKQSMPQFPPGDTQRSFMLSEQQSLQKVSLGRNKTQQDSPEWALPLWNIIIFVFRCDRLDTDRDVCFGERGSEC